MELCGREFAGPVGPEDESIPSVNGVYIIAEGDNDEFVPLYIGISENIRARILQHVDSGIIARYIKDLSSIYIYFWETDSSMEARLVERELIAKHKPTINQARLKEVKRSYEAAKRVDATRRLSTIVAGTSATIAIGIAFSMLFSVFFGGDRELSRKELSERIVLLESELERNNQAVAQARTEIKRIETELGTIARLPKDSAWASEAIQINEKIVTVDGKLSALESALTADPTKALAVPILRKDLDNAREAFKSDLAQTRSEIAQIYDLNKWFIGLMITIAVSVLGLAFSSFVGRRES
ncbi:GIY-YIG nuclease family protein [Microbulbifer hainanensis]|uniref:GIY-YIG nuclease family protein n=1 Tax=Microbulbifer hainanensis TaxID=2735675 RepID=UPI001865D009|nr:GIY-YIG nuclease family protein [Microbulbifer hainanensis]